MLLNEPQPSDLKSKWKEIKAKHHFCSCFGGSFGVVSFHPDRFPAYSRANVVVRENNNRYQILILPIQKAVAHYLPITINL